MIVNIKVSFKEIVKVEAAEKRSKIHIAQLLNYLKAHTVRSRAYFEFFKN